MRIYVNDESLEIQDGATVAGLLETMALKQLSGVAVAVNDEVVSRSAWESQPLNREDRVLLIMPIQGG